MSLTSLLENFGSATAKGLVVPVVAAAPALLVIPFLLRAKRKYQSRGMEPFTELPLRPAGESLRVKVEELSDRYNDHLMLLFFIGPVAVAVWATTDDWTAKGAVALLVLGIVVSTGRKLLTTVDRLRHYRLGYMGERVVGEELNQLMTAGFRVFHDLPFDGFNVDHVLVGSAGVYVVETKTRRKPSNVRGTARATVVFDGTTLHYPSGTDRDALEQTRRNARTVSEWLSKATGERVNARGILTLPGWWVERKAVGDVNVLNPSEIKHSFPTRPANPLSPEQIQRIAHRLAERCRMARPPKA